MKYCTACNQNVTPTKKFSILWFLINCLWLIGGLVYVLYYFMFKKKVCPICNGSQFTNSEGIAIENSFENQVGEFNNKADDYIARKKQEIEALKEQKRLKKLSN